MATPALSSHDPAPLQGGALVLAGVALALSNFVVVLDVTIANVSVPHISGDLGVSTSQGTWVITSYAVAEAISVPLTGWLAGRFGSVKTFLASIAGFGLSSMLCGLSPSLGALLIFRVFQGLCGGPIIPLTQTLILRVFPKDKAGAALGLWAVTTVVAPVAGPILGGLISDNWSWPWIFFINLPVVATCGFLTWSMVRGHETPTVRNPIDFIGLGLLVVWVAALQIVLDKGREEDWFASTFIVCATVVAAISFISFVIWELTETHPIVDLTVFRHRGFTFGTITQSISFGAFFAGIVILPLFLQTNLGYTSTWAGYATAFLGVLAIFLSPVVANMIGRVDVRILVSFGVLWLAAMSLWRTTWITNMDFASVAWPQFFQGIAIPFFFIGTTAMALGAVSPEQTASAAGLLNFARTLAGAFATSLATTAWEHQTKVARSTLVGVMNHAEATVQDFGTFGLSRQQALAALERLVDTESVTLATNQIFLGCAAIFILAAAIVWLVPKTNAPVDASGFH